MKQDSDLNVPVSCVKLLSKMALTELQPPAEVSALTSEDDARFQRDLGITQDELAEAKQIGSQYSPEQVCTLLAQFYAEHKEDPNIDYPVLERIATFLGKPRGHSAASDEATNSK